MTWEMQDKRRRDVKDRASRPAPAYASCRVLGCGKSTRAGTKDGLDSRLCRGHAEQLQRHGSLSNRGYTARVLNPYRRAALKWLDENCADRWVENAIKRVTGLYGRAGTHTEAFRLRGLSVQERAKAHWARLRESGVEPALVVAAWLAVELLVADDPQADKKPLFKQVQAAKLVHRMASGSHRKWETARPDPSNPSRVQKRVEELHVYPRSRGRVLVHIGKQLEEANEILVDLGLSKFREFKRAQDQRGKFVDRPYPKGKAARRRKNAI